MASTVSIEKNLQALGAALQQAGAEQVVVSYDGYGDSGDINGIQVRPQTFSVKDMPSVTYEVESWTYVKGISMLTSKQQTANFKSAASDILWQALDAAGHRGFENNEGGDGELTVFANGQASLRHSDNFEGEGETLEQTFDEHGPMGKSIAALARALACAGFAVAHARYAGSGDSGELFDLTYRTSAEGEGAKQTPPAAVTYEAREYQWGGSPGSRRQVVIERTADFESALQDVWDTLLREEMLQGGWENNDGGGGTVTLSVDGTLHVSHHNNFVDNETSTSTWNEPSAT